MLEFPQSSLREAAMSFEDVIAPLTRERFLAEFWEKKILHITGRKGRFTPLLPWDVLNEMLEWNGPPHPLVRLYQNNKPVDTGLYLEELPGRTRLRVGGMIACLSQGASLIVDALQDVVPRISQLASLFEDALNGPPMVNAYAGWGRQNAFDLHWDGQEVFILQISGRKHWKVYAPTRPHPLKAESEVPRRPTGPPAWEGILEDGDMLYMPRGWWHMAYPLGEPCLHLNFAIEPPNGDDFVNWLVPKIRQHPEVRANLPRDQDASGRRDYFAGLLKVMEQELDRDRVGEFLHEWHAYRRARPQARLPFAPIEQKMPFSMATRIRLAVRDALYLEGRPGEPSARLHAGGACYNIPAALVPAFERLSGRTSITLQDMCAGMNDQLMQGFLISMLDTLAGAGVILKEAP